MAVGQQWTTMFQTMADDDGGEGLFLVVRQHVPELAGQRDVADVDVAMGLVEHLADEVLVHRGLLAVGV